MADQVITAMAEAELEAPEAWGDYISPLGERIDTIRNTILANAESADWTIDEEQLDDRHIIRRMVLKRCIYGVDKNPWRWNWPRWRCGCTPSPWARRCPSSITICAVATASSAHG